MSKRRRTLKEGSLVRTKSMDEEQWYEGTVDWVGSAQFSVEYEHPAKDRQMVLFNGSTEWQEVK
jgi:hypothetical protein